MINYLKPALVFIILLLAAFTVSGSDVSDANNPLAGVTAINAHNYYMSNLSGTDDTINGFNIRVAQPFFNGRLLVRATVPINTYISSTPEIGKTGLGTSNIFATYSFVSKPQAIVGVGPFLLFPGTNGMGTESWQLGAALVAFFTPSPVFQLGGLVTWQMNVGGPEDTHMVTVQPFVFFQLGGGTYLRSAAISTFDIENDTMNLPVGFGIGKVFFGASGNVIYNAFIEPQFSIYSKGDRVPMVQFFIGFNTQFKNAG